MDKHKDGNENTQIYALPIQGGYPEPLVTGDASEKYYFAELSEDGKRLYYMTSESNPNFLNTHVRDLETQEDKLLEEGAEEADRRGPEGVHVRLRAHAAVLHVESSRRDEELGRLVLGAHRHAEHAALDVLDLILARLCGGIRARRPRRRRRPTPCGRS
mgnify:CR=1 FL=1